MKVWLDDDRDPLTHDFAVGWRDAVWVKTPEEAIALLRTSKVQGISLDNDLALPRDARGLPREGYRVSDWMETEVRTNPDFKLPTQLRVHSMDVNKSFGMKRTLSNARQVVREREQQTPE